MEIFKGLQPELVWSYFEEICKIPRPSKKEEKIAAWLMEFAKKHQLEARQDEAGNVLITKPATSSSKSPLHRAWRIVKPLYCNLTSTWCAKRTTMYSMISSPTR